MAARFRLFILGIILFAPLGRADFWGDITATMNYSHIANRQTRHRHEHTLRDVRFAFTTAVEIPPPTRTEFLNFFRAWSYEISQLPLRSEANYVKYTTDIYHRIHMFRVPEIAHLELFLAEAMLTQARKSPLLFVQAMGCQTAAELAEKAWTRLSRSRSGRSDEETVPEEVYREFSYLRGRALFLITEGHPSEPSEKKVSRLRIALGLFEESLIGFASQLRENLLFDTLHGIRDVIEVLVLELTVLQKPSPIERAYGQQIARTLTMFDGYRKTGHVGGLSRALGELASFFIAQKKYELFHQYLAAYDPVHTDANQWLLGVIPSLEILIKQQEYDEAHRVIESLENIIKPLGGTKTQAASLLVLERKAALALEQLQFGKAELLFREVLRQGPPPADARDAFALAWLGLAVVAMQREEASNAILYFRRAEALSRSRAAQFQNERFARFVGQMYERESPWGKCRRYASQLADYFRRTP